MTPFVGVIEDNLDPKGDARLKVRVYGVNDQKENDEYVIPTEFLPWAKPLCLCGGSYTIPKIGEEVYVTGDINYAPLWLGVVNVNSEISGELDDDSSTAHVLMYDTDFSNGEEDGGVRKGEHIKMYFTDRRGVVIDYKNYNGSMKFVMGADGSITISDINGDSIMMSNGTITLKSDNIIRLTAPKIELGTDPKHPMMNGDVVKECYDNHAHGQVSDGLLTTTPFFTVLPPDAINPNVIH